MNVGEFRGNLVNAALLDAKSLAGSQGLSGELQEDALENGSWRRLLQVSTFHKPRFQSFRVSKFGVQS